LPRKRVTINGPFVRDKLNAIIEREDLSKFIL
jgi:ATP-dependent protease HslVU (ClpYQ) ATPase subunit